MSNKKAPRPVSKNALDIGRDEELSTKEILAIKLNSLVEKKGISQVEAAKIIGMPQPKVSQVHRCKLQNISLERLMQALVSLDQDITIVIKPARHTHSAGITIAA